uniref:Glycosyltransferase family 17 n=1 Tax=Panagrellus redivivus TaxID=6233 RepID=A0A7E4UZB3_PANRE
MPITLLNRYKFYNPSVKFQKYLCFQAETWDDLISYAVFIIPGHEAALPLLSKLHHCHNLTRSKVSIHLVWMRGLFQRECAVDTTVASIESVFKQRVSCDNFSIDAVIDKLQHFKIGFTNYPINIMRNEARRGAPTKLHLVGDIETQWSNGFAKKARNLTRKLLNNDYGNAVLVYRRFEQDSNSEFPADIDTFAKLIRDRKIVQFHQKFFRSGHIIPNLDMWISYSLNRDKVLLKNLSYGHHEWEPQFIMRHDAPYHYEHTPTRYLDHQFLCYELCRAGYSFLLMTHVFNIHPGIKSQNSLYERAVDAYGRAHSYPILKKYGEYLNSEYPVEPDAGRRCPKWKDFL